MRCVYEAVFRANGHGFDVEFPDIENGMTTGSDLADAVFMAADLLEAMLGAMIQMNMALPTARFGHRCPNGGYVIAIAVDANGTIDGDATMTTAEAAQALGVTDARVRAMVRSGVLDARKEGRDYRIFVESVRARLNAPHRAGRPRKVVPV